MNGIKKEFFIRKKGITAIFFNPKEPEGGRGGGGRGAASRQPNYGLLFGADWINTFPLKQAQGLPW